MRQLPARIVATLMLLLLACHAGAQLDLRSSTVKRLDNGLTVIVLEDRNFPVVSTQMLYRVGARDESYGQTGIAHFLEHMAFRGSENFPDTGLVSSIYAIGGEWHGYTWTDQTTYFATAPEEHLDLLLRIEADRMSRLEVSSDDMQAERGAVLAEMHMYEDYPTSMLIDAVMFTSFLAHPYRNNTIGWDSDIENLQHEDVVAFYERHYRPANAVLAVVGDVDRHDVFARVEELFGDLESKPPTPLPHTAEPLQQGERRVRLLAETDLKRFMIGWRAPSANHPDFAPFLVLQEVLGGGSGVNFRQNDWGTPAREDAPLYAVADNVTTWYPPSAQDYIFIVGGTIALDDDESRLERDLESQVAAVRQHALPASAIDAAAERVLDELVYDVETTEDAAHQLAFFDGLGALEGFLALPERVARVTPADVQRVARGWLLPERRTIGWHVPDHRSGEADRLPIAANGHSTRATAIQNPGSAPADTTPVPRPELKTLEGGIPVIVQHSDFSSAAFLQVVLPAGNVVGNGVRRHDPVFDHSTFEYRFRPGELADVVATARAAVVNARLEARPSPPSGSVEPETVLEQVFVARMQGRDDRASEDVSPALIVLSGDVDEEQAYTELQRGFGDQSVSRSGRPAVTAPESREVTVHLEREVAQAQLGYIVPAPGPGDTGSDAFRLLLYILSHDYEGRLGKEAISNRGLAYYIDSRYRSDGDNGWITLAVGVDPQKLPELKSLLLAELRRLRDDPPTAQEVGEARQHFVGRARSAAQSNRELAKELAEQWLWYGDTLTPEALERRLARTDRQDVLDAVGAFIDGVTVVVAQ